MTSLHDIKQNFLHICGNHSRAKDILKKVNGRRDYKEIARILSIHPTTCSNILSKAKTFNLLSKEGNVYKKTPEFRHIDINRDLKSESLNLSKEKKLKVRKRKKIINAEDVKKKIVDYIQYNFKRIPHPFSSGNQQIKDSDLQIASEKLFDYIEKDIGVAQLEGLSHRFYEAFAAYFSVDRIRKIELISAFGNMIKCFEPFVKKVAAIKTNNPVNANFSLDKNIISMTIPFDSDIKKNSPDYWKDKPIHEASIRIVYPFRHMEAHEARDYNCFDMERAIYYMFASIIFINLSQ